ncbi:hypothetical protein D3C80_1933900 [compost metagenome]
MAIDLGGQPHTLQPVGVAGALYYGSAGGTFAAHEHCQADKPFIADYRDFRRSAVFHHIEQGND